MMTAAQIELRTLGRPALRAEGKDVVLGSRKTLAMLAFLSTKGDASESREKLAGLLWGDSSEEKARGSLRQAMSRLKESIPDDKVVLDGDRLDVRLSLVGVCVDHLEILSGLETGHIDERLLTEVRLADSFLAGYEDLDEGFTNWLRIFRQMLHDVFIRKLEALLKSAASPKELVNTGTAILNLDATHEPACRAVMLGLARQGDSAGALRRYNALWKVLGDDFDTEPSLETQELVADIKNGAIEQTPSPAPRQALSLKAPQQQVGRFADAGGITGHMLLIRPFGTAGVKPGNGAVVEIFRLELIAALTRFRDWRVFDLRHADMPESGNAYTIEANAYNDDQTLRFVLTLHEASSGRFIWSERFSINADEWFATQHSMIRRIAIALDINMTSERLAKVAGKPVLSLELFERWLRGQQSIFMWDPKEEEAAEHLFKSIVAEAPGFAPAHAGLAGILNARHLIFPGYYRSEAMSKLALEHAKTAVALDPLDSRTQLHLAWSYAMNGEPQKAAINFLLAYELNEDDPWTIASSANGLAFSGDNRSSEKLITVAKSSGLAFSELHYSYTSSAMFVLGRVDECIEAARQTRPELNCSGAWHAAALAEKGRIEDARTVTQQFLASIKEKWTGKEQPTDREVTRWLLQCFPIAQSGTKIRFATALRTAGFAVETNILGRDH